MHCRCIIPLHVNTDPAFAPDDSRTARASPVSGRWRFSNREPHRAIAETSRMAPVAQTLAPAYSRVVMARMHGVINVRAQDITPSVDQLEPLSATPRGGRRSTLFYYDRTNEWFSGNGALPGVAAHFFAEDAIHVGSSQFRPRSTRVSAGVGKSRRAAFMSREAQSTLAAQQTSLATSRQLSLRSPHVSSRAGNTGRATLKSRQEQASLAACRSRLGPEHSSPASSRQVSTHSSRLSPSSVKVGGFTSLADARTLLAQR